MKNLISFEKFDLSYKWHFEMPEMDPDKKDSSVKRLKKKKKNDIRTLTPNEMKELTLKGMYWQLKNK
jgi:hypothetical protein